MGPANAVSLDAMTSPDSLHLDTRQRAMLAEMKVPVWWPEAAVLVAPAPVAHAETPRGAPVAAGARTESAVQDTIKIVANNDQLVRTTGQKGTENLSQAPFPASSASPVPAHPPAATGPVTLVPRPEGVESMGWPALREAVAGCQACKLCVERRNTVFGVGDTAAEWMIVGEAPGENEDLRGEPFVGQAGKLLDNMLRAVGLDRAATVSADGSPQGQPNGKPAPLRAAYIANVIKCRPPGNRNPEPAEVAQCEPYLRRQVALLQPKIILAMGRFAVNALLADSVPDVAAQPLGKLRGQVYRYGGVPVVVSYHPAYLLRNLPDKAKAWADLCLAMEVFKKGEGD